MHNITEMTKFVTGNTIRAYLR